jgi:hypothetical protein
MKWFRKKTALYTVGYSLAIIAWFSYSSLFGLDMLSYTKSTSDWKVSGYSQLQHK